MNIITFNKEDIKIDITFSKEENTIWMSQSDIAILFKRDKKTISYHINKMMTQSDDLSSTVLRHETVDKNGKGRIINHYNLDIIKQIGYKIDHSLLIVL